MKEADGQDGGRPMREVPICPAGVRGRPNSNDGVLSFPAVDPNGAVGREAPFTVVGCPLDMAPRDA